MPVGYALSYTDEESSFLAAYFGTPYTPSVESVYDAGSDERALWPPETLFVSVGLSHTLESGGADPMDSAPTGYSIYGESSGPEYHPAGISLTIIPEVAWTGAANPFDADAELWIKAEMWLISEYANIFFSSLGTGTEAGFLEIELAGSRTLEMAIFSTGASATVTTNPRLKATAWWPYKTTAGAAAWNTTTGAAANGGPGS